MLVDPTRYRVWFYHFEWAVFANGIADDYAKELEWLRKRPGAARGVGLPTKMMEMLVLERLYQMESPRERADA